jgi:hypothetical protein
MDVYQLTLEFKNGPPYIHCQKPTDDEIFLLPHIVMTLDVTWDPSQYDIIYDSIDQFYNPLEDTPEHDYHFDQHGGTNTIIFKHILSSQKKLSLIQLSMMNSMFC